MIKLFNWGHAQSVDNKGSVILFVTHSLYRHEAKTIINLTSQCD